MARNLYRWCAAALCASLLITAACAPQEEELLPEDEYQVNEVIPGAQQDEPEPVVVPEQEDKLAPAGYDMYKLGYFAKEHIGPDETLYKAVFDAVQEQKTELDISAFGADRGAVEKVAQALEDCYEFGYFAGLELGEDGKTLSILYEGDLEQGEQDRDAFRAKVSEILQVVAGQERPAASAVMELYHYLCANITLDTESGETYSGALHGLLDGRTDALGFAQLMRYLLDQMGVEVHITFGEDIKDVWNTVKIDGEYFHLDAAREAEADAGQAYKYFGLSDKEFLKRAAAASWSSGKAEGVTYETPAATGNRFTPLQGYNIIAVDFAGERYYTIDTSGEGTPIAAYDLRTQETGTVCMAQAASLAFYKGLLYFSDTADGLKLKSLEPESETVAAVADLEVTRLLCKADGVYAYDDVRGEETIIKPE